MRSALLVGLMLSLSSCSDPVVSQVMVLVDADARIRTQAVSLVIRVSGGGRERGQVTGCDDGAACQVHREELPIEMLPAEGLTLALAPDKRDWRRLYEASVTAYDGPNGTGTALATTRVISGYVRGETRLIRLFLQGSCIGVDCDDPDLTCRAGECVDPFIPPDMLDPFIQPDAGREDGGMDASMDAPMCARASDCNDGVECTFDDCVAGSCQYTPRDALCTDPDPCLDAICDSGEGCRSVPNTAGCNDGDICNGVDQCEAGTCRNIGPERCPDLTCMPDGTCTGCTGGDCPGTQICMDGTCECDAAPFEALETSCDDFVDNDCNGLTDCEDPSCEGVRAEVCDMATTDEDCDGAFDEGCIELDCSNGADDDSDSFTDCDDDDCATRACTRSGAPGFCSVTMLGCCAVALPEMCGDFEDYDCDGISMGECMDASLGDGDIPEVGFDDVGTDADFDAGFEDTGFMDSSVGVEIDCWDLIDDDGDTFVDCDDEDCVDQVCGVMLDGMCTCTPVGDGSCSPGDCLFIPSEDAGIGAGDAS